MTAFGFEFLWLAKSSQRNSNPKAVMLNYKQVQAFVAAMLVLAMTAAAIEVPADEAGDEADYARRRYRRCSVL
ncbi:hypothetical protein BOX15_Mlig001779g4 [Macrostomum lignano]|uniref:Uncharacterized protein n=1 Tax=Macrostomum lignano TaxID=282301 RepID=A0A267GPQ8_9PLAT|nr:hypothetical protein BOX15_Mlig001779g4 [Macrostomum lignano]